jgi:hypothetical protein
MPAISTRTVTGRLELSLNQGKHISASSKIATQRPPKCSLRRSASLSIHVFKKHANEDSQYVVFVPYHDLKEPSGGRCQVLTSNKTQANTGPQILCMLAPIVSANSSNLRRTETSASALVGMYSRIETIKTETALPLNET